MHILPHCARPPSQETFSIYEPTPICHMTQSPLLYNLRTWISVYACRSGFEEQRPSLRASERGLEGPREVGFASGSTACAQSPSSSTELHSEICKKSGFKFLILQTRKLRPRASKQVTQHGHLPGKAGEKGNSGQLLTVAGRGSHLGSLLFWRMKKGLCRRPAKPKG